MLRPKDEELDPMPLRKPAIEVPLPSLSDDLISMFDDAQLLLRFPLSRPCILMQPADEKSDCHFPVASRTNPKTAPKRRALTGHSC